MTTLNLLGRLARAVAALAVAIGIMAGTTADRASALTIAEIQKRGTLAVGLSDVSPPYAMKNEKMEHVGLEVELADMIAKALGVKLKVVIVTAANRVACLLTDCADILIYGLTVTPERATQVWFSQPYAVNASGIIAAKGVNIASLNDLVGKRVGVIRAAFGDPVITEKAPQGTTIQRFDDMSGLLQAMLAGHVDAIFENTLIPGVLNTMRRGGDYE
ncbi:MAG: transporter substrate-binding domain-containing protein, partial [Alphaproteobacteria bacterium]|nr:transporter substrate-binding domain-containing protein [Alphaproteobacteria bacterium]